MGPLGTLGETMTEGWAQKFVSTLVLGKKPGRFSGNVNGKVDAVTLLAVSTLLTSDNGGASVEGGSAVEAGTLVEVETMFKGRMIAEGGVVIGGLTTGGKTMDDGGTAVVGGGLGGVFSDPWAKDCMRFIFLTFA